MHLVLNLKNACTMPRNRHTHTILKIKGVGLVEVVTVAGLAEMVGKSRITILRYEQAEVFPPAPIRVGSTRYYPLSLARKLVPLVAGFAKNKKPSAETIVEINTIFKEERNKLCQQK